MTPEQRRSAVLEYVQQHPGVSYVEIAHFTGLNRNQIDNAIMSLENNGILFAETLDNRLMVFEPMTIDECFLCNDNTHSGGLSQYEMSQLGD